VVLSEEYDWGARDSRHLRGRLAPQVVIVPQRKKLRAKKSHSERRSRNCGEATKTRKLRQFILVFVNDGRLKAVPTRGMGRIGGHQAAPIDRAQFKWGRWSDAQKDIAFQIGSRAMLVLTRKEDQAVHIGANVVIRVLSIDKGRIRLGIDAPRETPILRSELMLEMSGGRTDTAIDTPT
jgi:carbon storage regulator CsrA